MSKGKRKSSHKKAEEDSPKPDVEESCANCHFFQERKGRSVGLCRLDPTSIRKHPEDWCGQWSYAEEKTQREDRRIGF